MQLPRRIAVVALVVAAVMLSGVPAGADDAPSSTTTPSSSTTSTSVADPTSTTTITVGPSTTTAKARDPKAPPVTGVPDIPTAGPPTTPPPPGTPPTTVAPPPVDPATPSLPAPNPVLSGVNAELDQLAAIDQVNRARQGLLEAQQTVVAATEARTQAEQGLKQAQALAQQAKAASDTTSKQLAGLALAAYTGFANEGSAGANVDGQVLVGVVAQHDEQQFTANKTVVQRRQQAVAAANDAVLQADAGVTLAKQQANVAQQLETSTVENAKVSGAALASATTGEVGTVAIAQSPTILGPPTLTAQEMAAWFVSTGHTSNATVPIEQLAADYLAAGQETGVRGDIAFAQSIIETGYFSFPGGGQLTADQNNFAGIGACDSCASGWSFPDALTGVTAQEELLEAYASPQPVQTPLVGDVGVGGCCPTWSSLSGKWATDPNYGQSIMRVYEQMLASVVPGRLTSVGLAAGS